MHGNREERVLRLAHRVLDLWRVAALERERLLAPADDTTEDAGLRAGWVRIHNRALGADARWS